MKLNDWLQKAKDNKDVLRGLIASYHPINLRPHAPTDKLAVDITAPQAERACEIVRDLIRKESLDCPEIQFDIALQKGDIGTIYSLLQSSWFGVPESTSCWRIPGFGIACDLLDDPVEEETEPQIR